MRKYPLKNYLGELLWVLETQGKGRKRDFVSRIIGLIRFGADFEYSDLDHFRLDEHRHGISKGSSFDWEPSRTPRLYGWVVSCATYLPCSVSPPAVKGMIGAKATKRRFAVSRELQDMLGGFLNQAAMSEDQVETPKAKSCPSPMDDALNGNGFVKACLI